jgi:hypothetical protein
MSPICAERTNVARAAREKRSTCPNYIHIQQWVSRRIAGLGIRFPGLACGEDIADDSASTFEPAEDRRSVVSDGHKTGHGPATFGDYDFDALLLDLVKQSQALRFEGTGSDFLRHDYGHIIIVIFTVARCRSK